MEVDALEKVMTEVAFGRWQIPIVLMTVLVHMLAPVHLIGSTLLNAQPGFRCKGRDKILTNNISTTDWSLRPDIDSQWATSKIRDEFFNSKCLHEYEGIKSEHFPEPNVDWVETDLPSCPWILQDNSTFSSSVSMEYTLVCERSGMRPLFQMAYSVGSMVGNTAGGHVSDRYGRKRAIQIACVINLLSVIGMSFSPWYTGVIAARVLAGCSVGGMILPVFSLALETTPSRHRTLAGMLLGTSFSGAVVLFSGVGYFIRTWRLQLWTASSPILLVFPLSILSAESPRWLCQRGRGHDAVVILGHAARKNRGQLTPALVSALQDLEEQSEKIQRSKRNPPMESSFVERMRARVHRMMSYLRFPELRRIIAATTGIWYLQGILYLGIILNANNFTSNDPYFYVALSGLMDLIAILVATPLNMRLGRRCIIGGGLFVAGVLLLLDLAVPEDYGWIQWMLVMTALLLIAACFQVNFLYVPELYPTVIRSRGFALASLAGSLGFLTAPFITDILALKAWWATGMIFGLSGIVGSLLVPLLPETNNKPLPDTLEDVEKRRKGKRKTQETVEGMSSQDEEQVVNS